MKADPQQRILIIDDDIDAIAMLQTVLEHNGYGVISALNGKNGLSMARRDKPDLIVLDVMMPDVSGYEVCGLIKTDPDTVNIPVIMLTGRDMGEDVDMAIKKRADWFVVKPYDISYLMSKINAFLKPKKPATPHEHI